MLKIIIIAGEHSGDILGSKIMYSIKNFSNEEVFFEGVGGPLMRKQGLKKNLVPFSDLSVMGIFEVIPKIPRLIFHIKYLKEYIISINPDILITIDSPDFNFRLVSKLTKYKFHKIHFVAPSVWAWRPGRAKKISNYYNYLFTLLPFEPKFFTKHGLPSTYIGNPIIETLKGGNKNFFLEKFNYKKEDKILLILPGSRLSELKRMLPIYIETSIKILNDYPNLKIFYMVPDEYINLTNQYLKKYRPLSKNLNNVLSSKYKSDIFSSTQIAIATSGTVSLELAVSNIPSIICYKMSFITYFILKFLVRTKWISLPNIILDQVVYPEFIQRNCTVKNLYKSTIDLLLNNEKYFDQTQLLKKVKGELSVDNNFLLKKMPSIIFNLNKPND